MPEKVTDKIKRLGRELADSVRSEIDLRDSLTQVCDENRRLKKYIQCYVSATEGDISLEESVSFVKGFYEAKSLKNKKQMQLNFIQKS